MNGNFMLLGLFSTIANAIGKAIASVVGVIVEPLLRVLIGTLSGIFSSFSGVIVNLVIQVVNMIIDGLLQIKSGNGKTYARLMVESFISCMDNTYKYLKCGPIINMFKLTPINFFTGGSTGLDMSPTNMSNPYYLSIRLMKDAIMPTAMIIFSLIVLIELFQITIRTEGMRNSGFESPFKLMVKVAVCKILLDNTQMVLEAIFNMGSELFVKVYNISQVTDSSIKLSEDKLEALSVMGWLPLCMLFIQSWVQFLFLKIVMAIIPFLLMGRVLEMYIFIVLSPIPFATFASQELSQIGKTFLKQFIAISLRIVVMYVIILVFGLVIGVMTFDYTNIIALEAMIEAIYQFIANGQWWLALATLGAAVGLKPIIFAIFLLMSIMGADRYTKAVTGAFY